MGDVDDGGVDVLLIERLERRLNLLLVSRLEVLASGAGRPVWGRSDGTLECVGDGNLRLEIAGEAITRQSLEICRDLPPLLDLP